MGRRGNAVRAGWTGEVLTWCSPGCQGASAVVRARAIFADAARAVSKTVQSAATDADIEVTSGDGASTWQCGLAASLA